MKKVLFSICFLGLLFLVNQGKAQQDSLTINLAAIGIIEGAIESMTDNVLINVVNNYGVEKNVYFVVGLVGNLEDGRTINVDNQLSARDHQVDIGPGGLSFTLTTLIEQYQETTLEDYNIRPNSIVSQVQNTRQLPAGSYNLCLEARSIYTDQLISAPGANNCIGFNIEYRNPPIIQSPENNSWIGYSDQNEIQVIWSHDIPRPGVIFYNLEIVRIPNLETANEFLNQGSPHQLFESFERILLEENIPDWRFNTLDADVMPNLSEGDILAVRVTAVSESVVFRNLGRSDINVFVYGVPNSQLCNNPSISAEWVFPNIGDTLPFTDLFPVARFQPSCDNILEMRGDIHFARSLNGALVGATTVRNYVDNWRSGPGPANYLRNYFRRRYPAHIDFFYPQGSNYEQYLPFLHGDLNFSAKQGEQVNIFGALVFTKSVLPGRTIQTQTINLNEMNTRGVIIGMPRPRLISPPHDATVRPGQIEFNFSTGEAPENILPPFKIFKLEGFDNPIVPGLHVKEKCVIQVSKHPDFQPDSIVFCRLKKIQGNPFDNSDSYDVDNPNFETVSNTFDLTPERQFDRDHFLDQVFKEFTVSMDFAEEDTLYWRVVWLKSPDNISVSTPCSAGVNISDADIYHKSNTRRLIVSNAATETQIVTEGEPSRESVECSSPCVFPAISSNSSVGGVEAGSTFTVAGFTVEVVTSNGGTSSNGTGRVIFPFLNNIKVRVNFSGITINAARQMLSGTITPVIEQSVPMSQHVSTFGQLFSMDETAADAMEAALEAGGKLTSLLSSGSEIALPIGIDKDVSGTKIIIGITSMTFKKDTAHMNMVVNIKIPNLDVVNGFISLGAKVCITNEGFGNHVKLYLPQDQVFPMGNNNEFRIKGAEGTSDESNVTSVEWDCNGFRELNLVAAFRFTRDWLLPENERGEIRPTGQVEARLRGKLTKGGHIMMRMDMDAFQIPGAEGWGFRPVHNAYIDLSELENPEGLRAALPAGYRHASLSSDGMQSTWKGFFLEEMSVMSPEQLQGPDRNRLSFTLRNMFIDNTGISFSARAENILRWDGNGNMAGWAASLDTIFFDIVQNDFRQLGFNGKLGLPIADQTQYMKYQAALVHREGNFNLVISVRPAENIRIPISMATASIRSDSYVQVSLGASSYIEAGLSATLSLGNNNLPEGQSMPATLAMPGIEIENLIVNSETGLDGSRFRYSLTGMGSPAGGRRSSGGGSSYDDDDRLLSFLPPSSNESTLSGFPIGLDHFSISNDRITIQPRITLTGSEGGFSAAARVSLLISMDLASSPQRFDLTGVQLDRIDLNITSSDVTLAGYLEFYNTPTLEGLRGGLTVGLNLGIRVGIDINADFGTYKNAFATTFNNPNWYSFFYVDGVVVFSPGITLFSGVSLYGLGGGFYHHMRRTGALPSGGSVLSGGTSSSPPRARESMPYEPHYDTDLGLKFMLVLGSNDNGQAYNLDVTLEASFSFSHGLTMLQLTGSFRVMTDGISVATIGRQGNSPIAGYLRLTINTPPAAPATMNGQFFVILKIPTSSPILHGLGSVPNPPEGWRPDNALVWATFKASPDSNYFWMGTPTNRCGVGLTIADHRLLEVTSYLMIGDGIPLVMPEPHDEFVRIFNRGQSIGGSGGDPADFLAGKPIARPPVGTGSGFAFGMSMFMGFDAEFFPFFFALKAVLGFDINITYAPPGTRVCAESRATPGVDGWYAMGQFYAGIEGKFGIRINLFFATIEVPILEAGAALVLRGGLPNPEWVAGRGSFYYNVCDGLVSGNCSFALQAGPPCIPVTTGNPLGDITLIQDITPHDGSTDVSVYTTCEVAFSMQMNKVYEIPEYTTAIDPPVIRRIRPYLYSFSLSKNDTTINVPGSVSWNTDNNIYTFDPSETLYGDSAYNIRAEARISENGRDIMVRGSVFSEVRTSNFSTGPVPDKVVEENLDFTYPYRNQQNFLKGETIEDFGYIRLLNGRNSFLIPGGDVSEYITTFKVKLTSQDGEVITKEAYILDNTRLIAFKVNDLQPEKIYCVQIIRKDEPIRQNNNLLERAMTQVQYSSNPAINQARSAVITDMMARFGESSLFSNQYKRIRLPNGRVDAHERELFSYYFRTSKYFTWYDKLKANSSWQVASKKFVDLGWIEFENELSERLEWVDLQNFKVGESRSARNFTPRVKFYLKDIYPDEFDPFAGGTEVSANLYINKIVREKISTPWSHMNALRTQLVRSLSYNPFYTVPVLNGVWDYRLYYDNVRWTSDTRYVTALDMGVINSAFGVSNTGSSRVSGLDLAISRTNFNFTPNIPSVLVSRNNAKIMYSPHLRGWLHYRQLKSVVSYFAFTRMANMFFYAPNIYNEFMTSEQRARVDNILSKNEIIFTKMPTGRHEFGVYYVFPSQNGVDVYGTMKSISHNYWAN